MFFSFAELKYRDDTTNRKRSLKDIVAIMFVVMPF